MDGFFQAGIGHGDDMMSNMEAMMKAFQYAGGHPHPTQNHQRKSGPGPCFQLEPVEIPDKYAQEACFQPGYDDEKDPTEVRNMIKIRKNESKHNYDVFEDKLEKGILDAPSLNLHQVPPSIFDNDSPITIIYLKDNHICELTEFFFDELPFLTWLDLRDNKLTNLPSLESRHECLRVLLLQGNRLRSLPYTLALAVNLKTIGITDNPLTSPPEDIQKQGCKKMLEYFKERMIAQVPTGDAASDTDGQNLPVGESGESGDDKLREDLKKTALKCVKPKSSNTNLRGQESVATLNSVNEEKRRADKMIYTWELWKRVPYDGVRKENLFENTLEEIRNQVLTKLNAQQESLLQKCKNQEVLRKWRSETKLMQMNSKPDLTVNSTKSAPFGNDLNGIKPSSRTLRPSEYKVELEECWDKLKKFSENPCQLSNTDLTLGRLREVEDIHKRLMEMKLSVRPPMPTQI